MYKVMLVDDEGIVIDALRYIIERNLGDMCSVESAKTGRGAIELAESFRPDIVFMDIQMPGINGIEAMKDIQSRNKSIVFIVLSAYDQFNYAKQAIDLGVLEYLMKPVSSTKVTQVLKKAMNEIDIKRKKMSDDLAIREKLQTVVPVIENSFLYTLLFQEARAEEITNYKSLLGIEEPYGYVLVLEYGDADKEGELTNPVGASVKIQNIYAEFRETVKEFWTVILGEPMANRITMYIPYEKPDMDYNVRIQIIENARILLRKLTKQFTMSYKMGIGSVKAIEELQTSYREALEALHNSIGKVSHIEDIPVACTYEKDYPIQLENALFGAIQKGNVGEVKEYATRFFEWMTDTATALKPDTLESIRIKVIEFVLWAEHMAFESGSMETYHFGDRSHYLKEVFRRTDLKDLKIWFVDKVSEAAKNIYRKKEKQASSVIHQAKEYIKQNFCNDISLDRVSREVNISPYYFSKLFKEEMGENFVEYITNIRMEQAKQMLANPAYSIKEVCAGSGYSDPNYFSRIFKKCTGLTPSEYREGGSLYES